MFLLSLSKLPADMEPGVGIVKVRSGLVEIILRFFITVSEKE